MWHPTPYMQTAVPPAQFNQAQPPNIPENKESLNLNFALCNSLLRLYVLVDLLFGMFLKFCGIPVLHIVWPRVCGLVT